MVGVGRENWLLAIGWQQRKMANIFRPFNALPVTKVATHRILLFMARVILINAAEATICMLDRRHVAI